MDRLFCCKDVKIVFKNPIKKIMNFLTLGWKFIVTFIRKISLKIKFFLKKCLILKKVRLYLCVIKEIINKIYKILDKKIFSKKLFGIIKSVVAFLIFIISIFLIVDPFLPELNFRVRDALNVPYQEEQTVIEEETREVNSLVIPSIGVDIPIVEGDTSKALKLGAWRRPKTGTPDKGGNTVLTGHRYQYLPPNNKTFYNLDKIKIGDLMYVYWDSKKYTYEVFDTFIVDPSQIEVEDPLDGNILTIYTCHPLWTADKRYVVRGKLVIGEQVNE